MIGQGQEAEIDYRGAKTSFWSDEKVLYLLYTFVTRDLFKKIRDTEGTVHAKMGTIKDRNGMELTEAGDKKRWQEYTEEL